MRWLARGCLCVACIGCARDRPRQDVRADPAPSEASVAPSHDAIVLREQVETSDGPFESYLAYPHVDLPSGAGATISATIEDDLRRRGQTARDRWTAVAHDAGAAAGYRAQCKPDVVATGLVSVSCQATLRDERTTRELWSYVWLVDDGAARPIALAEIVGASKMADLATLVSARLAKQLGASVAVVAPADLVARHALDGWVVTRNGLFFDFLPGVASPVRDELYVSIDWVTLRGMASDARTMDRMKAEIDAPGTLFGYPRGAKK